jgi:3-oxoacyl-[acyl-carrier protein] reductase
VTDAAACGALVADLLGRWTRLDLLVHNAGVTADRLLVQMEDAEWDRVMEVNLKGAFLCARAVLPPMVARREGHILNVASFAARSGARGQANYTAAKAGVIGLTLSLAREVGRQGIRANVIVPGAMRTGMTSGLTDVVWDGFRGASVLGTVQETEDVARLAVAVAGSRGVSGQVLQLDGRIAAWA